MISAIEFGGAGGFWMALARVLGSDLDHRAFIDPKKAARRIVRYQYGANTLSHYDTDGIGRKERIDLICGRIAGTDRVAAGARQRVALRPNAVHAIREAAAVLRAQSIVLDAPADLLTPGRSREFQALLGLFTGWVPEVPRGGWRSAGFACAATDDGYTTHWRVLDLASFDGPVSGDSLDTFLSQSRSRLYLVCTRGRDGRCEVLLDHLTVGGLPETLEGEADHAVVDVAIATVYPFTWRAGGFMNSPVTPSLMLPSVSGDNVAIAVERTDGVRFVRRLIPEEVERSFRFPTAFTEFGKHETNGKTLLMSDTARYDVMKSATAPAVIEWILKGLYA